MSKVRRRPIKEKDAKKLISDFFEKTQISPIELPLEPPVELVEVNNAEVLLVKKIPVLAKSNNTFFPTLVSGNLLSFLPKATVNMGAVPYVCNGADIMAPGIVDFQGLFEEGDIVLISDEHHQKPIAVTIALCDKAKAMKLKHGKIFKNIHYVGDRLWSAMKELG